MMWFGLKLLDSGLSLSSLCMCVFCGLSVVVVCVLDLDVKP